jgi:hypothetical protein
LVLLACWLWLAFSSGGFIADQWLLPAVTLGFFGLVVSLLGAYPRRPGKLSLAVVALFSCYSLVVALSALWANSPSRVWMESGRTFLYLLVLTLALVYLSDSEARRLFRYVVMAGGFILLMACVIKLGTSGSSDIAGLFIAKRFSYPVSYPNNAAALLLVLFWPLLWLAAGPKERAPVRAVALGLATGLLALSFLTQSRGAIWSLLLTALLVFLVSPARLRMFIYLLVPALLMTYVFPNLNRYWVEGPEAVGGTLAASTVAIAVAIAVLAGLALALLERLIRVGRRVKVIIGSIVLIGVALALYFGTVALTSGAGGPAKWVSMTWQQFTGQQVEAPREQGASRFTLVSSTGRVPIWRVAVQELKSEPLLGVGADNFVFEYDRLRTMENYKPKQAHSFELQVLGETGALGGVFAFGGILLAAGGLLWPRFFAARKDHRRGGDRLAYGWDMALLAGCAYWLVHASVDWLWQMPGVTIPAILLLAAGLAAVDSRAEASRPLQPGATDSSREPRGRIFRLLMVASSLVVIVFAGLPYLSLQIQDSARGLADTDVPRAAKRAAAALSLVPSDPGPYETQSSLYDNAATRALASDDPNRAATVLDSLSLRLASLVRATAREPIDWSVSKAAGVAALDLYLARGYAEGWGFTFTYADLSESPTGAQDWSALAGLSTMGPGLATGSPAVDETTIADVQHYRGLTQRALAKLAYSYLASAERLNPLASQIDLDLQDLDRVAPATGDIAL